MNRNRFWKLELTLVLLAVLCLPSCVPNPENPALILATTTSTQDSGLLDILVPAFEAETGYTVQVVAVGTGEALKMGEEGNADVLFVHAPSSEMVFMDNDFGSDRRLVMHNDFMIVGSAEDPAGLRGLTPVEALSVLAGSGASFVSRADDSGTNKKELSLWKTAGIEPVGQSWYVETGQGMGATLIIASETGAYTLTDRASYLANRDQLSLDVLVEGDTSLLNVYHVIVVNPELWPDVNNPGAIAFADFICSAAGQKIIADFGLEEFGQPLFTPDADKTDAELDVP